MRARVCREITSDRPTKRVRRPGVGKERSRYLTIIRINIEIVADPQIKDGFATLFIRDLSHVLLYKGMILEPKVYQLGQTYMLQHLDLKSVVPYGSEEVNVRLR